MFSKDFYDAWIYVPFLLVAYIFGAMSGFIGGVFQLSRIQKYTAIQQFGALINIALNILLINYIRC